MISSEVQGGSPENLGVTLTASGANVAVFSAHATAIELCLFDAEGSKELRRIVLPERSGDVFHGHVLGIAAGTRYGFRAYGDYVPTEGHRFNPAKLLLDPYARAIDRPFRLHASMFGYKEDSPNPNEADSAPAMPKAVLLPIEPSIPAKNPVPWSRTVLYELHVRGFTRLRPDIPAELRGSFAGLAHPAAIAHLVRLGVTSVEILPAAAWIEERHLAQLGLSNYWGYNPVALLTPDPRLAPGGWAEIRATVASLADAGIETIVDVVLNHTGEGDEFGPTLSLRGLDNASYYRLRSDDPSRYIDDSGCGNCLALDRQPALRLAMDALRSWADLAGVHGFRFDLATALGRRDGGFDPASPLLAAIAQDPVLRRLKRIAEPWDVGPGGYQAGAFAADWGEWNDRFRDDVRKFWRGDAGQLGSLATRLAGSHDLFAASRRPSHGVNFVVAHDGFTLADVVSYDHKNNQANGENGRDGTNENFSWNNGAEGETDDPRVRDARGRDQRALLATLLLSRGTPMLAMGSELGQSQRGNNNAYAQDNETAWICWSRADAGLQTWTARLTAIRRDHPAFRADRFLTGEPTDENLLPDVEWRRPDGGAPADQDWEASRALMAVFTTPASGDELADRVALAVNGGREAVVFVLPEPRERHAWRLLADSANEAAGQAFPTEAAILAAPRAILVLAEAPVIGPSSHPREASVALDRLAAAAGIHLQWWEVNGTRHIISTDTKRSLLAAMRLPAATEAQARDSLGHLAATRDRRLLPYALSQDSDRPAMLRLAAGHASRPPKLIVALEDGSHHALDISAAELCQERGIDGRIDRFWRASLPTLPIGRHRLMREDAFDIVCNVTISPMRAFLPPALQGSGRRFGVAAQLYTLRRQNDRGIGDFNTLRQLAVEAAAQGAATVALNPMHALFPQQPERASPYQPSDRRFLDPIYLDLPQDVGCIRDSKNVDYAAIRARKQITFEHNFGVWQKSGEDAAGFEDFVAKGGQALARFATFEAIAEVRPREPWTAWPDTLRRADTATADPVRIRFHQYLQWQCERQLSAAAAEGRRCGLELGLLRDLAVGAAPDGAEAWANADGLAHGVSIGAPPDPFAAEGQIWGLPPPDPQALLRDGFAMFSQLLAANMRHAGGLRIDHVMGFSRLFWVPDGATGAQGAYVDYPLQGLLAQLTLESARRHCLVVGEDLGTVPAGLRETLSDADILGYRVLMMERDGYSFRSATTYPSHALACVTTHDLPPLAGWWEGTDIAEDGSLGRIPPNRLAGALTAREMDRMALTEALRQDRIVTQVTTATTLPADIAAGAHSFVARSPASLMLVQVDDLAGARIGINLPGTDTERPNWRRRLSPRLPELLRSDLAQSILDSVRRERPGDDIKPGAPSPSRSD